MLSADRLAAANAKLEALRKQRGVGLISAENRPVCQHIRADRPRGRHRSERPYKLGAVSSSPLIPPFSAENTLGHAQPDARSGWLDDLRARLDSPEAADPLLPEAQTIENKSAAVEVSPVIDGSLIAPTSGGAAVAIEGVFSAEIGLYPEIAQASIKHNQKPALRVQLIARSLDRAGRGWIEVDQLHELILSSNANIKTSKRIKQILSDGEGVFWIHSVAQGRLWLPSPAKLGKALGVQRLSQKRRSVPIAGLLGKTREANAHLMAVARGGLDNGKPRSRGAIRSVTGVSERTQQRHDNLLKTQITKNIAIGEQATEDALWTGASQHHVYTHVDHDGRCGVENQRHVARQLPNSYEPVHKSLPNGRRRKLNQQLGSDLVTNGTQGNGQQRLIEKRYFTDGRDFAREFGRTERDCYHLHYQTHRSINVWSWYGAYQR